MGNLAARWAQQKSVRNAALSNSAARELVARYVAGHRIDDLISVAHSLLNKGLLVSIEYLGSPVDSVEDAQVNEQTYLSLIERISAEGIAADTELSLRLSRLGQRLGTEGHQFLLQATRRICRLATNAGLWVTIDMSNSEFVEQTFDVWGQLQQDMPETGITVQSALFRTQRDITDLSLPGRRIRLCKGTFRESKQVAFRQRHEIDLAYVRNLRELMNSQAVALVASHDPRMISIAEEFIRRTGRAHESYEFQMLYGVRPMEQRRLADIGHRARVLVPFGPGWYDYYTQRLAERPANAALLARSLIGKR